MENGKLTEIFFGGLLLAERRSLSVRLQKTWQMGRHRLWALMLGASLAFSVALAGQTQQDGGTRLARATSVHTLVGGRARIQFADAFRGALRRARIAYDAVGAATTEGDALTLPVADGLFDLASGRGAIVWRGGLALETPRADVDLRHLRIDTIGRLPLLWTTLVVAGELTETFPLCTVTLSTEQLPIRLVGGRVLTLRDVELRLTTEGAARLNRLAEHESFASGQLIGAANIIAIVE
ncbi:MAG: hypothetical protein CFK52_09735 [Chloracidobacterium sp. CP2_5A]|nr:MAG: hypothetical protein CFK52_09735 [Chloracidobacterium sp. CP2_5A]